MTTKKTTAAETYATRRNEVARLVDLLGQELKAHAARAERSPHHWTHAGDLGYVREGLVNLVSFLSGIDPAHIKESLEIENA